MNSAISINNHLINNEISALAIKFNQFPILSAEEETLLAQKVEEENDLDSAHKLVLSHMRYVIKVAKGYLSYGLPAIDIVQEGTVGLMKAVKNFDYKKGIRLVTYATHWIKAEIHEYIIKNWRLIKVATTKAQRKLFFNLRKMKKQLSWLKPEERQEIANNLGVQEQDVLTMESRMVNQDLSFNAHEDDEDNSIAPEHIIYDETERDPLEKIAEADWQNRMHTLLPNALKQLNARERQIIDARWLKEDKLGLKELAAELGISLERVRQLEKQAIEKMAKIIKSNTLLSTE